MLLMPVNGSTGGSEVGFNAAMDGTYLVELQLQCWKFPFGILNQTGRFGDLYSFKIPFFEQLLYVLLLLFQ